MVGSLTGVVASKRVTEAFKGSLSTLGNRAQSAKAKGSLTVRLTSRAGGKPGLSDPGFARQARGAYQSAEPTAYHRMEGLSVHRLRYRKSTGLSSLKG